MACTRIAFPALTWSPGLHPLERKKTSAERPAVMIEFAPGFDDPNVCVRAHVIFVVRGTLDIVLDEGTQRFGEGECCWLDAGTRHRACNPGAEPVVAFIASDVEVRLDAG
jgi:quercetin dioxygenase-like cupin family protein